MRNTLGKLQEAFGRIGDRSFGAGAAFALLLALLLAPIQAHADVLSCAVDPGGCLADIGISAFMGTVAALAYAMLVLTQFLLFAAATMFNWVMLTMVFDFGHYFGTTPGTLAAWGIMRDIGNLCLLFGFIFIGIATILNLHGYQAKKALPNLIIFAVLLNFSLFIASAVIDTSNLLASTMYKQVAGQSACDTTGKTFKSGVELMEYCTTNYGPSKDIFEASGIGTVLDTSKLSASATGFLNDPFKEMVLYIGLALLVAIMAFVLFAGTIMLVIRGVVLALVMVTAPIGFVGMAIPPMNGIATRWWKELLNQSFFAPVFLLLFFIGLKVSSGVGNAIGKGSLVEALSSGNVDTMGVLVVFAIVISFIVGALVLAKQMGAHGADFATRWAGRAVIAPSVGLPGLFLRNTVGRRFNTMAHGVNKGMFYDQRKALYKGIAGTSFSARGVLAKATKLDMGKVDKKVSHGYHSVSEAEKKSLIEQSEGIGHHDQENVDRITYLLWQIDRDLKLAHLNDDTYRKLTDKKEKAAWDKDFKEKATRDGKNYFVLERERANLSAGIEREKEQFAETLDTGIVTRTNMFANAGMRKGAAKDVRKKLRTPASERTAAKFLAERDKKEKADDKDDDHDDSGSKAAPAHSPGAAAPKKH